MRFGGLNKCSFIDFPGKISAIVFTIGCNFRCPYCHNPELVDETADEIPEIDVLNFLTRRQNLLDAVVVTGGEPTVQSDLVPFLRRVKGLGYLVKLDTNGTNPSVVREIIEEKLVDYIAMDIKAPVRYYERVVGRPVDPETIRESIALLVEARVPYEFRTTVVKALLSPDDLRGIGEDISGAQQYFLQKFIPTKSLNPAFLRKTMYSDAELEHLRTVVSPYVVSCTIR